MFTLGQLDDHFHKTFVQNVKFLHQRDLYRFILPHQLSKEIFFTFVRGTSGITNVKPPVILFLTFWIMSTEYGRLKTILAGNHFKSNLKLFFPEFDIKSSGPSQFLVPICLVRNFKYYFCMFWEIITV